MNTRILLQLVISFFVLLISIIISLILPNPTILIMILIIVLSQISSSIFFPIIVGYYQEKQKQMHNSHIIWDIFQDLSEGGILKIYKDRERNNRLDNGETSMKEAFLKHKKDKIKIVGVSLRVFFNQAGQFYGDIINICELNKSNKNVEILALISSEDAPETINRAKIESPDITTPTIKIDINSVEGFINNINATYNKKIIKMRKYMEAPYCTAIIFPDKCFFSPNLLCSVAPVKLPLIVFGKGSHGYKVLNQYFDFLWSSSNLKEGKDV